LCGTNNDKRTLAERTALKLEEVYWILENNYRQRNGLKPRQNYKRTMWENPQPKRMVTNTMPMPVLYLLTQARLPFRSPVPNVSVFSSESALKAIDIELQKIENSRQWKRFPKVFERRVERLQQSNSEYLLLDSGW
jgi:hypothetical protein